jgi:hypothetical protein
MQTYKELINTYCYNYFMLGYHRDGKNILLSGTACNDN